MKQKALELSTILTLFILFSVYSEGEMSKVIFQFPEFDYKENTKNELSYREFELACDQLPKCQNLTKIHRKKCVRECISPSCYQEIYRFDELEDGEIDVRLNSFKGCFIQRLNRARN